LAEVRVVLDCANGAASDVGPHTLRSAGADVIALNDDPNGLNINEGCGSTHLEALRKAVLARGADVGFALDGDADRCLAVDHTGATVDGDQLMAMLALDLQEREQLAHDTIVATVMSNLGLVQAMRKAGITVEQTAVGDRYVLEAMRAGGFTLGGEQSGHIIMREHATTGDGILTALHVLQRMTGTASSLRDLASVVTRLPQVLINVPGVDKDRTDDPELAEAVVREQEKLGDTGRVLLRPSGTEPLVRVMVEAATSEEATEVAERLADVVRRRLAL
jgi:phosphoglucosamine mutase